MAIPGTLYVDCTASAVGENIDDLTPVFAPGRINLQMIRQFQPCFSSALIAFIESSVDDGDERRALVLVDKGLILAEDVERTSRP